MKIIDWYILKRFITTFLFTLLVLVPITIVIDIAEKIDNFLKHEDLTREILIYDYYVNFVIYFTNTFMPLALFLAVIIFTSRLSNNTEIIAINDAQVSFTRFLYPYFIGASLVTVFALVMNHFIVPSSNKSITNFENKYISKGKHKKAIIKNISLQINDSTYIHFRRFDVMKNSGSDFSIDVYKGLKLSSRVKSTLFEWNKKDSTYKLMEWTKRIITDKNDIISSGMSKDTIFGVLPKDFINSETLAKEIKTPELLKFIETSQKRGVKNLNVHWVELHKRTSLPIATYILTMIAVGVSYKKQRGGIGGNLALGLGVMFLYIFFLKVSEVLGAVAEANPFLNVWIPNCLFGTYAIYLYFRERK